MNTILYSTSFSSKSICFYTVLTLAISVLLSCKQKTNSTENNIPPKSSSTQTQEQSFEGQWICAEKNWKVVILKVDDNTYNVKWWYNLPAETLDEKASGTYNYFANLKSLRYNGYEFKFAVDGRLYETSEAVFFTKE